MQNVNANPVPESNPVIPTLTIHDQRVTTTSLAVARHFGKKHKNIIQAIERLDIPADFNRLNFQPVKYSDEKGQERPMYILTRDGFTLLAMGFTGRAAMIWKIRYLEAFNRLEARLHGAAERPSLPVPAADLAALLKTLDRLDMLNSRFSQFLALRRTGISLKMAARALGRDEHGFRPLDRALRTHGLIAPATPPRLRELR